MEFEKIVNYIENSSNLNNDEANFFVNNTIKKCFKTKKDINNYFNLLYIVLLINIRKVNLSKYSKEVLDEIKAYYVKNKPLLGLQIIKWYKSSCKIKDCIDFSLNLLNSNINEANLYLLDFLLNTNISDKKKELIIYIIDLISDKKNFDFEIYKKIDLSRFNNNLSTSKDYILSMYKEKNCNKVFEEYLEEKLFNYNFYDFTNLDLELSYYIKRDNLLYMQIQNNLEDDFDKLFSKNNNYLVNKNNSISFLDKFIEICSRKKKDFYTTNTCREFISNYILQYDSYHSINDNRDNIILTYLYNNKDKVIFDRQSINIINALRIKRIIIDDSSFQKLKLELDDNINIYDEKIKNFIKLTNSELNDFIKKLNSIKIKFGLIPMDICKYIIKCIITYNQFYDIKECIFCDLASNLEQENGFYNIYNYIDDNEFMDFKYGSFISKDNIIKFNENLINSFSKDNLKAINTIFHEIGHLIQHKDIINQNFSGNRYKIYIESILCKEIKDYNKLNYYNKYSEIDARLYSVINLKKFLSSIKVDLNNTYITANNEKVTVSDYIFEMELECHHLFKTANIKKINNSRAEDIMQILNYVLENNPKLSSEIIKI